MKRTILASVTVGLAALMTIGCGNVVSSTVTGNPADSNQPIQAPPGSAVPDVRIFAVNDNMELISFRSSNPRVLEGQATLTEASMGTPLNIVALDFRPTTGILYGLSAAGDFYYIDRSTAQCFEVGAGLPIADPTSIDIDFNPQVDAVRVISRGQNERLNANDGDTSVVDTQLTAGGNAVVGGCATAYNNNEANASSTTLYTIDSDSSQIFRQLNPNNGVLDLPVTLPFPITSQCGFDFTSVNFAFIAANRVGTNVSELVTFRPADQKVLSLGEIAGGRVLKTIAVELAPPQVTEFVSVDEDRVLTRFSSQSPDVPITSNTITGLGGGELIRGLDLRPGTLPQSGPLGGRFTAANGVHVLTTNPTNGAARVYQLNLATGQATLLSTLTQALGVEPADTLPRFSYGVDFNPVNDRLRITSAANATGVNATDPLAAAANQTTRNFAVTDVSAGTTTENGLLNFAAGDVNSGPNSNPVVPAVGYAQSFMGTRQTRLFGVDTRRDCLVTVDPASGVVDTVGDLGINASHLTGLDIEANNRAWLVTAPSVDTITGNTTTQSLLFRVNLANGQVNPAGVLSGKRILDFTALPPGI